MRLAVALGGLLLVTLVGCASTRQTKTESKIPTPWPTEGVLFAGVRSSEYGIKPFPLPEEWDKAMTAMVRYFPGARKAAIWIVGTIGEDGSAKLEFPGDGNTYPKVVFAEEDKHEPYLRYFDEHGVYVFLQVEPGFADVLMLIDLVLNRYGHHPSVIGFGVDVEWYKDTKTGGIPITNSKAQEWEERVKAHNPNYRLFLKHWEQAYMPPSYRGEIVFVDDSQQFKSLEELVDEFTDWAERYYPNPVFYQIGYPADKVWWGEFDVPPQEIGQALAKVTRQTSGIFWVDFTLRQVVNAK